MTSAPAHCPLVADGDLRDILAPVARSDGRIALRGTAVSLDGRAILLAGRSGAGKTSLAAELIVQAGACLVSDDLVLASHVDGGVGVASPGTVPARIELRGIGLVPVPAGGIAPLAAILLLAPSARRLPASEHVSLFGRQVELLRHPPHPALAAKIALWLRAFGA